MLRSQGRLRRTPSETALPSCKRLVPPCYVPEGDSPQEEEEEEGRISRGMRDTVERVRIRTLAH